MNKKNLKIVAIGMSAITLATTAVVSINTKQEVSAASYFERVSMKQCEVELSEGTMPWTGAPVCPTVIVKYNGKELTAGVDYEVKYKNNVDAGVATAIIKGIGEQYKGKQKVDFYVKGIDINETCTVKVENFAFRNNKLFNDKVYLYEDGKIVPESNYTVSKMRTREKYEDGFFLANYLVTTKYIIRGKGKYEGIMIYEQKGVAKKINDKWLEVFKVVGETVLKATEEEIDELLSQESTAAVEVLPEDVVVTYE